MSPLNRGCMSVTVSGLSILELNLIQRGISSPSLPIQFFFKYDSVIWNNDKLFLKSSL